MKAKLLVPLIAALLLPGLPGSRAQEDPMPSPAVSPSPSPSPMPTATPCTDALPCVSPRPSASAGGKPALVYELGQPIEGQITWVRLSLPITQGPAALFPLRGQIEYQDFSYDRGKKLVQKVPFEMAAGSEVQVPLIFQSPGKKTVRISVANAMVAPRNLLVFVQPFPATVFPQPVQAKLSRDPRDWHVWVNMHIDKAQRQYYQVTYQGEIIQRLLTSTAREGHLTPLGQYTLGQKLPKPKSTKYESVMPFWVTIVTPALGIGNYGNHGLEGESYLYYLGVPASHGCLRLSNKWIRQDQTWVNIGGAKWVYSHVPTGTPVSIFRAKVSPFAFEDYRKYLAKRR